jgi:hypothetical protein
METGVSDLSSPAADRDVVCGAGVLGLDLPPALVQVPDFGDRLGLPSQRSAH